MHIIRYFRYTDYIEKTIKWAKSLFNDWLYICNRKALDNPGLSISPILVKLEDMTVDELNYSICPFNRCSTCS